MAAETNPVQIQIQTNQIFDEKKYCFGYCRRNPNVFGLICCMTVYGSLIATIYLFIMGHGYYRYMAIGLLAGSYIIYLLQAFFSKSCLYLWNMKVSPGEDINMYIEHMKKQPPILSMTCQCYHYETRTRTVTEHYTAYVNGKNVLRTRTRVEKYQEKVFTYNGSEVFYYSEWSDDSGFLIDEILKHNVVRIDLFKSWIAANPETQVAFDQQYNEFMDKHRHRDTHFISFQVFDISGYKSNILWVAKQKWYLNWQTYAMITIFCLSSVFYRYWLNGHSVKAKFELKKVIKL